MGCPGNLKPWTAEEYADLKALRLEGYSPSQIAKKIGRAESSVRSRIAVIHAAKPKRPCMCCGKPFPSAGSHNRLCSTCGGKNLSPYAP